MKEIAQTTSLPFRLSIRSDLHLARKIWHLGMGTLIAGIYMNGVSKAVAVIILGSFFGLDLFVEMFRLRVPSFNAKVLRYWGILMRNNETTEFSGVPYYLASSCLAIALFPAPVASLSILLLAFGDPFASLFGNLFGHWGPRFKSGKTLIGTSVGVLTCATVSYFFLKSQMTDLPKHMLYQISIIGGLVGGISELLPLEIDDNFSVPMVSGFVLWFVLILYGL